MTRTKTFLSRVALAVGLGMAAASAHAVPIVSVGASGAPPCEGCTSRSSDYGAIEDWSLRYYWHLDGSGSPLSNGEYAGRRLNLKWSSAAPDFVDSKPTTLLPSGYFVMKETWDCIDAFCDLTGATRLNFEIESPSVQPQSVPEPGTLALLAVGLLGGVVTRRSSGKSAAR